MGVKLQPKLGEPLSAAEAGIVNDATAGSEKITGSGGSGFIAAGGTGGNGGTGGSTTPILNILVSPGGLNGNAWYEGTSGTSAAGRGGRGGFSLYIVSIDSVTINGTVDLSGEDGIAGSNNLTNPNEFALSSGGTGAAGGVFRCFSARDITIAAAGVIKCNAGATGINNLQDNTNSGRTVSGCGGSSAGYVELEANWSLVNNGTEECKGASGTAALRATGGAPTGNADGGGGGPGGRIVHRFGISHTAGTQTVTGGAAGAGVGTGVAGSAGAAGSTLAQQVTSF